MSYQKLNGLQDLCCLLKPYSLSYWLDSGSLLGVIRNLDQIEWDSDIDLGIWEKDVPIVISIFAKLRDKGYKTSWRTYKGRIYGFTLMDATNQTLRPIHIHVYFHDQKLGLAWSPQTVIWQKTDRANAEEGLLNMPRLRSILIHVMMESQAKKEPASLIRRLWRCGVCYPLWGIWSVTRNRLDRQWWSRLFPFSLMHATYTWKIPASFFLALDTIKLPDGSQFLVPSNAGEYLRLRYGDWRTPVKDWVYWTDDGCIFPEAPERAPCSKN